ncbi:hypothetical protein EVAR_15753_1 [Eumeta japonica]|uniref:Uncharacterized protein n=1 Tax=Eumeta variegata TaxID=151549 RepID=A0A4C1Z5Z0_EUMVA|nr:hypothetical protein EVAR_15753_1 [Eumeta japonica]
MESKRPGSQNLSSNGRRTVETVMLFFDTDSGPRRNGRRYLAPLNDYRQRSAAATRPPCSWKSRLRPLVRKNRSAVSKTKLRSSVADWKSKFETVYRTGPPQEEQAQGHDKKVLLQEVVEDVHNEDTG